MRLLLILRHNGYGAAASFNWNGSRSEHMGFEGWGCVQVVEIIGCNDNLRNGYLFVDDKFRIILHIY